jgi:hypothetical protein
MPFRILFRFVSTGLHSQNEAVQSVYEIHMYMSASCKHLQQGLVRKPAHMHRLVSDPPSTSSSPHHFSELTSV